jgi:hypothetical protein
MQDFHPSRYLGEKDQFKAHYLLSPTKVGWKIYISISRGVMNGVYIYANIISDISEKMTCHQNPGTANEL